MRKLTYYVASTVDGYIAGPDGSFDFFPTEGDHVAAIIERYPETLPTHVRRALGIDGENTMFDTVLMGRATYEIGLHEGYTSPYAHLRQYVFSRSMAESPDPAVRLVSGDPVAAVRDLKREEGAGLWLCGGGSLAGSLREEVNELLVKIYPVVAGSGIPLFAGEFSPRHFALTDSRVFNNGVALMTYQAQREGERD